MGNEKSLVKPLSACDSLKRKASSAAHYVFNRWDDSNGNGEWRVPFVPHLYRVWRQVICIVFQVSILYRQCIALFSQLFYGYQIGALFITDAAPCNYTYFPSMQLESVTPKCNVKLTCLLFRQRQRPDNTCWKVPSVYSNIPSDPFNYLLHCTLG